ncbi:glycoside hydrolase family 61 protein [Moniliophthora roreri MCA 2997]|uniref:AA9 family lytic polysaccharide monooxygenase n=1 Tax=Moniliophthora roreri (strain MCA 2997) TaxID=1381753 RepID=V2X0N4_MONRO|nr:glycoside hydrolase family 61 protein [Moniliophthora roreri MCA 2997]
MNFLTLAVFVSSALFTIVSAHTRVYGVWVNGVFQGDGRELYIRSSPTNDPIKDLKSGAMECNANNHEVPQWIDVKGGDKLTLEWYREKRNDNIIASSHHGPVQVYIAPASSNSWTKLFEEAYDATSKTWATNRVAKAHGQHSIKVPHLEAGTYLVRGEMTALHQADQLYSHRKSRGVQFYISCIQIRVTSNVSQRLPEGTKFPGTYKDDTPGIQWDLYGPGEGDAPERYIPPGPSVWEGAKGGEIAQVGKGR